MRYPVRTENLTKKYYVLPENGGFFRSFFKRREIFALNKVNLHVQGGEVYGILGPNGAGKTTLIRVLATTILPDDGTAYINGLDIREERNKNDITRSVGVVLGEKSRSLYWRLTARKNLEFYGALYDLSGRELRERVEHLLKTFGLEERADDYVYHLSEGMKFRLLIARALLHDPPILLFDDPTTSLDPIAAYSLRELVKRLAKREHKAVLITTYHPYEGEDMCDRIGIMDNGKIIAEGTKRQLAKAIKGRLEQLMIELERPVAGLRQKLSSLSNVEDVRGEKNTLSIRIRGGAATLERIIVLLKEKEAKILNLKLTEPSLDEIFRHLVKIGDNR